MRIGNADLQFVAFDPFCLHFANEWRRIIHIEVRLQCVRQLTVLARTGKTNAPAPLSVTGRNEFCREIERDRSLRRQIHVAFGLGGFCGRIELQLDIRFAGNIGVVMQHSAQDDLVAQISETRQRRLQQDRFADLDGGFPRSELVLLRGGDGDEAVTGQAIGRGELCMDAALPISPQGCVPKCTREEVFP